MGSVGLSASPAATLESSVDLRRAAGVFDEQFSYDRSRDGVLLPPSVDEWLPENHLARFVVEVVEGLDLRAMSGGYRGSGSAPYHPRMLVGLGGLRLCDGGVFEPQAGLIGVALAGTGRADPAWSARLYGAADQALADLGHTLQPLEARLAGLDRQRLRGEMGAEAFEAEYAAGRTLDLAQVVAGLGHSDAAAEQAQVADSGETVTVLTGRELDVLKLVAQGLSNAEIARRLVLSEHTVHRHLANILRKLGLSSRALAAAWGVRTGLV